MNPLVSIVMATRNCARTLPCAIASIRQYGADRIELLICDAASTDGTVDLIRQAADWWVSEPDRGVYDAMNKAVRHARGAFVYFLGADDALLPGFAEALGELRLYRTVYYGDVRLSSNGARYAGAFTAAMLARTNICHQAIFYPRAVFDRRSYELRFPRLADWAFNMACWSDPDFEFRYIPHVIAQYNDRGGLSANAMDWTFYDEYPALLRRHFPFGARWRPLILHALSRIYRTCTGRAGVRPGRLQG